MTIIATISISLTRNSNLRERNSLSLSKPWSHPGPARDSLYTHCFDPFWPCIFLFLASRKSSWPWVIWVLTSVKSTSFQNFLESAPTSWARDTWFYNFSFILPGRTQSQPLKGPLGDMFSPSLSWWDKACTSSPRNVHHWFKMFMESWLCSRRYLSCWEHSRDQSEPGHLCRVKSKQANKQEHFTQW